MPLRILHIEDDPEVVALVSRALREVALVDTADSLGAAQSRLSDVTAPAYDLLLVDLCLPDSHGIEAIEALKAYRVPIIVISNAASCSETLRGAAVAGADDFLIKGNVIPLALVERVRFVHSKTHRATRRALTAAAFEALKPYITYGSKPPFVAA